MVIASASGALPMLAIALIEPSFLRPGALPILTAVVVFTVVTVAFSIRVGTLGDIEFAVLGSGGMLGVAISAYLIADPAGTRAVTSMLAIVPAIAASGSPHRMTAALTTASMALATALSISAVESSGAAVTAIAVGAAMTTVLVPVILILGLRRSLTAMNARLEVLASTDPLTGLLNRRGMLAAAEILLRESHTDCAPLVAMVLDIDRFKTVNDEQGHAAGDGVLVAVADVLRRAVDTLDAPQAVVARIGGEEFLVVMQLRPGPSVGTLVLDAVRAAGQVTVSAGSVTVHLTPPATPARRYGLGSSPGAVNTERAVDVMVHAADRALYDAKSAGRDRACHGGTISITWSLLARTKHRGAFASEGERIAPGTGGAVVLHPAKRPDDPDRARSTP